MSRCYGPTHQATAPCVRRTSYASDRALAIANMPNTAHWWNIRDSNPADILLAREATTPSSPIPHIEINCLTNFFETQYLNHTYHWVFTLPPLSSSIFSHQGDKSELRGATPNFLPRLYAKSCTGLFTRKFHRSFRNLIHFNNLLNIELKIKNNLPYGYFNRRLSL